MTKITGAGLTWVLVKRTNVQSGTAEIWRTFATSALAGVTVTATLSRSVASSLTVMSFRGVDTTGVCGSGAIGGTGTGNAANALVDIHDNAPTTDEWNYAAVEIVATHQ